MYEPDRLADKFTHVIWSTNFCSGRCLRRNVDVVVESMHFWNLSFVCPEFICTRILSCTQTHTMHAMPCHVLTHAQWVERSMALGEILWLKIWHASKRRAPRSSFFTSLLFIFCFHREEFVAFTLSYCCGCCYHLISIRDRIVKYIQHILVERRQWIVAYAQYSTPRWWW